LSRNEPEAKGIVAKKKVGANPPPMGKKTSKMPIIQISKRLERRKI